VIVYLERFPWKTRKWEIVYEVNNYVNNFSKQLRKQCPKLLPSLPPWADAAVGGAGLTGLKETIDSTCK
jgi:hypothetical protein